MRALQIELIKLNRLANYVMLALLVLIVGGVAVTSFHTLKTIQAANGNLILGQVWSVQASIVNLILAVFIIMNIGKEYSDNTLRRAIIDGYTRDEFYRSKLLVLVTSVVFIYLIQKTILVVGGISSGQFDAVKEYLTVPVIINTLVKLLSVGIMAFFLAFVTRSIAMSIVIYFVWNIIEGLITGLEKFLTTWTFDLGNYLPQSSIDKVLNMGNAVQWQTIVAASVYMLLMLLIPYFLLLKRDIK